jgi:glutathione S-transferase
MASKSITLYTAGTPNGHCVSILLAELAHAYPDNPVLRDYDAIKLSTSDKDIGKVHNQVKSPWFLELNPNGRIPTIVHDGFPVFETSAILVYLTEVFDKERKLSYAPSDVQGYSKEMQWLFFTVRPQTLIFSAEINKLRSMEA